MIMKEIYSYFEFKHSRAKNSNIYMCALEHVHTRKKEIINKKNIYIYMCKFINRNVHAERKNYIYRVIVINAHTDINVHCFMTKVHVTFEITQQNNVCLLYNNVCLIYTQAYTYTIVCI